MGPNAKEVSRKREPREMGLKEHTHCKFMGSWLLGIHLITPRINYKN